MLSNIFSPTSVTIVGASTRLNAVGNDILKNLIEQNYKGQIFPINPKASEILGLKAYSNIEDLETIPDLAIVAVPAKVVPVVMKQIAKKGVKGVVVISAGFSETGIEGRELERQVADICIQNNITLIGPNCLGVINPLLNMNASFAASIPPIGKIGFLSQSGAICSVVIDLAKSRGLGFSKFVSVGNKALCKEAELIRYFENDEATKVIVIYAEMIQNAAELISVMKLVKKPVVILKAGKTEAGATAASSHTGALASSSILFENLFEQANIIQAESMDELFDLATILSYNNFNQSKPVRNTAIITNAGGLGVLTTDGLVENGMLLAKISEETKLNLQKCLPEFANFSNPIDVIGDAREDRYFNSLKIISKDDSIDSILVILTPQSSTEILKTANTIVKAKQNTTKPIIACFVGGSEVILGGIKILTDGEVACCQFPDQAAVALAKIGNWSQKLLLNSIMESDSPNKNQARPNFESDVKQSLRLKLKTKHIEAKQIFDKYKLKDENYIPESDAKQIIGLYGIQSVKSIFCASEQEADELISKNFGSNLVMKIISPDIMHKSDVGGVMIGVDPQLAGQKYGEMMAKVVTKAPKAKLEGILFAEMLDLDDGAEFILGAKKDSNLGNAIMVGMGGVYVEMFSDVSFGFPPLNGLDIDNMIDKLASSRILQGSRGKDRLDRNALKQAIINLADLLNDFPEIVEVDLNPVLVLKDGEGLKALDAKIVFKH